MKTLGIIGGMGPLATVKLFEKIVLKTKAKNDQSHIHTIIDSNTNIPDRSGYILEDKENPLDELIKSAKRLEGAGADFLIMPCNTAHYFYEDIIRNIEIPFLSMIEETAIYIQENHNLNKVGLLATSGTYKTRVYERVFNKYSIDIITPLEEEFKDLMKLIYDIKMGSLSKDISELNKIVDNMKKQGVTLFVIGCTELSVIAERNELGENLIDAMDIISESAIKYAKAK